MYARSTQPLLIIVCGLQGTGKSAVASYIARRLGAAHLRTDAIRKELFPHPTYRAREMSAVYTEMFRRARRLLQQRPIVFDATFSQKRTRAKAIALAQKTRVPYALIETICPERVVRKRLTGRTNDPSDATFQIFLEYKNKFEPIIESHIILDTSKSWRKKIKKTLKLI